MGHLIVSYIFLQVWNKIIHFNKGTNLFFHFKIYSGFISKCHEYAYLLWVIMSTVITC